MTLLTNLQRRAALTLAAAASVGWSAGCVEKLEGCEYTGTCPPSIGGSAGQAGSPDSGGTGGTAPLTGSATSTHGGAGGTTTSGHAGTANGGAGGTSGGTGGTTTATNTGGTSGGSGGAGGAGGVPCDGACEGNTPVCDEATDSCVECVENDDCDEGVCDTETRLCVECLGTGDCEAPTPLCDDEEHACVECLDNSECSTANESRCEAGSCTPCQTNDDCAHVTGTTVCDAGTCVECTLAEEAVCGGKSCNPATNTCTETDVGSVGSCEPCLADSECIGGDQSDPDRRCVPMEFQGEPRDGGFCLWRVAKTCDAPFNIVINAASLSGAPEEPYCGINPATTRCEAVLDLLRSRQCPDGLDTSCGCARNEDGECIETGQGGLCRAVGPNANRCTFQCGLDDHCPNGTSCADSTPDFCQ